MGSAAVFVDVVFDNTKDSEINSHDYNGDYPSQHGEYGADQASKNPANRQQSCDEGQSACDWVEDECASQSIGRICTGFAERGAIDCRHYISRFVANSFWRARVLIGGDGRNIENAMTKGPERDRGMTDVGLIFEGHFEDSNVANHWGRDSSYEEEERREEY